MAWRLYTVPMITSGSRRCIKYFATACGPASAELIGAIANSTHYGASPWALVAADLTGAQHTFLSGQSDVRAAPVNLDNAIGAGALSTVVDYLEAADIPAGWVTAGTTWRALVRNLGGLFQFAQRYAAVASAAGVGTTLIPPGANLNTEWQDIPQARQDAIIAAAASLGYSGDGITATTTARQILKTLADQWGAKPFQLGGMNF